MREPVLHAEDVALWNVWMETAKAHSKTNLFKRRLAKARQVIADAAALRLPSAVMWSGGKDSTALTHLVCIDGGLDPPVFSEKDDLDYPGEEEYVTLLARAWGLDLKIIRPAISPACWLAEHGHELEGSADIHSRAAGLSKDCFYSVVEKATADCGLLYLGLRAGESHGRAMNFYQRGSLYQRKDGKYVCTPLAAWQGIDVFAYMVMVGIPFLPVYQCIAFMHADEPWRVRKSWWVPGASGRYGGVAWLRHYYPSLFRQLCRWIPQERGLA